MTALGVSNPSRGVIVINHALDPMNVEDPAKIVAAREAVKYVRSNSVLGVGTGSTAMVFLRELAKKIVGNELMSIKLVPTSTETEYEIVDLGLGDYLRYPWQVDRLDLAIDGADEVDSGKNLIKGGGGALTREKIIDYWAREFIVIIDESKLVDRIPKSHPIPIEVLPFAWSIVRAKLEREFGGKAVLRVGDGKRGPVVTDNGNYILDYTPGGAISPVEFEVSVKAIPGVVETGVFSGSRVSRVIVGKRDGSVAILS